jgi:hypothetical protein
MGQDCCLSEQPQGHHLLVHSARCTLPDMPESCHHQRRLFERKPAEIAVTILVEGSGGVQIAKAIDLSQAGMRLNTHLSIEPGKRVGLLLGDGSNSVVPARVVWLGKIDSEQAGQAGLEFLEPLGVPV